MNSYQILSDYSVDRNKLKLLINDDNNNLKKEITLHFNDFEIDVASFLNLKRNLLTDNGDTESVFKYSIELFTLD